MNKEDRNNFSRLEETGADPSVYGGIFSGQTIEPIVEYISSDGEKIYKHGDSWIVFGRDRNEGRDSGYGGRGDARAFSMDIVVGRTPASFAPTTTDAQYVDPNFFIDAARVFLSQKTNLDEYFHINGENIEERGKAGIGIKSDYVRIISKNSLRLVTMDEDVNSRGGTINKKYGIELVAGNDYDALQPMALGQNLAEALTGMLKLIDQLSTVVDTFANINVTYLNSTSAHFHYSPFNGLPTTPSELEITSCVTAVSALLTQVSATIAQLKMNMAKYQMNYLSSSGEKPVLSPLNKTN